MSGEKQLELEQDRLALFFVALPDPIPIPHGSTISFTIDGHVPYLVEIPIYATSEVPPFPNSLMGAGFVSLKFWQVNAVTDESSRVREAISKVVSVVVAGAPPPTKPDPSPAIITVVEMVTFIRPVESDPWPDPFMRCLSCLTDVIDAYRISEGQRIAPLSYERLDHLILTYQRSLVEPYTWWGPVLMMLDHNSNVQVPNPELLDAKRMDRLFTVLGNLRSRQPFTVWAELGRERNYAYYVEGNYSRAVIQAALATEVLVSTTLACLLWEETFPREPTVTELDLAAELLGRNPQPLRAEVGKLLGGNWDVKGVSPSAVWQRDGARLRNKVVHVGYRPAKREAAAAIEASVGLDTFIRQRLATTAARHHRTAAMLLGEPGLQRLGGLTNKVHALLEQADSEPDWVESYRNWREAVDSRQFQGSES